MARIMKYTNGRPETNILKFTPVYSRPEDWSVVWHGLVLAKRNHHDTVLLFGDNHLFIWELLRRLTFQRKIPVQVLVNGTTHNEGSWEFLFAKRAVAKVCSSSKEREAVLKRQLPTDRISMYFGHVDREFFSRGSEEPEPNYLVSAGMTERDYRTLCAAVDGLPVKVWSSASASMETTTARMPSVIPDNVVLEPSSLIELRNQYRRAAAIICAINPRSIAGQTLVIEGFAMRRPVIIAAENRWLKELSDQGLLVCVPSSDPAALRKAIQAFLEDPAAGERMAQRAYDWLVAQGPNPLLT
jgi:glycosyltransferase involved in cell wall biosynthesis